MSFYARAILNPRLGGQQQQQRPRSNSSSSHHQSRGVNAVDDSRGGQRRDQNGSGVGGGGGGGIARFSQPKQPHRQHQHQQSQNRQAGFYGDEIFRGHKDDDEADDDENFPIDGSIHAQSQREDRNFSQVTLSQLSDGPSVRSIRSHRSSSLAGCCSIAPAPAPRDNTNSNSNRSAGIRGNGSRGKVLNDQVHGRHFNSALGSKQKQQILSQSHFHDNDDANSLKSSQTLLSQYHRPSSNGGSRPSSSQSGMSSVKRTTSRESEHSIRQVSRDDGEDNHSILSSQPLLSVAGNGGMSQRPPKFAHTLNLKQQQQHKALQPRTPSCLSNIPSLREHGNRYSSRGTAIRTMGAISGTLASLSNPSQALRSMRSMAVRTSSSLVALTPFRKGRVQSAIGSNVGAPLLSSMRRTSAFSPTPMLGQSSLASSSAASNQCPNVAQMLDAPSLEQQNANLNMNSTTVPNPCSTSLSIMPPSVAKDDDRSNISRTEAVEPSVYHKSASNLVLENHAEKNDTNNMHSINDDIVNDSNISHRDHTEKTDEVLTATRELKCQLEQLEKSKQEFHDMNERARREIREEYVKLEALQQSIEVKYGTMQTMMDTFSTKMASSAHDHDLNIRTLVNTSMNELRQERRQVVDAISMQVHEQVKVQLPSVIRSLIETETRQHLLQTIVGMVDSAKSDFQQWISGVKNAFIVSGVGSDSPNALTAAESTHLDSVGGTTIGSAGGTTTGSVGSTSGYMRNDTVDDTDACARVDRPIIRYDTLGNEQLASELFTAAQCHSDVTPMRSTMENRKSADLSNPRLGLSKNCTSCEHVEDINTSSLTPVPRSSMSTWTTPFSRKATPLKNNYAKNKLPVPSSGHSRRDVESEMKLDNDILLDKSPSPPLKTELQKLLDSSLETGGAPPEQSRSLIATTTSGAITTVKVVANASPNESKPSETMKSATSSNSNASKRKAYGRSPNQALVNITSKTVNSSHNRVVIDKTPKAKRIHQTRKGSEAKPTSKKASRKRDQSDMTGTSASPRRSKRQKEANRIKPIMAAPTVGVNRKPSRVTPKEDRTPVVKSNYDWLDADSTEVDAVSYRSTANGYDSLLGTSVAVPTATTHDCEEDSLLGLDDNMMELSQPEKRSTLTSLLPFVGGFSYRGSTAANKPTKTFSKKRPKSKISASYDFEDFNFS
ncbi:hypothetical protein ACHAWU_007085 [Discostella pseudostelligera]|uniref:Uncharacterized protein n=1 Tax=Discostella pseudostelligera TaxID=259834 RepID=A0ABD3N175_9STRA